MLTSYIELVTGQGRKSKAKRREVGGETEDAREGC